jgi:hypothetical protein
MRARPLGAPLPTQSAARLQTSPVGKKFCQFRSRAPFIGAEPEAPATNPTQERDDMQLTKHAQTRMQQRGITETVLDLLYTYGRHVERGSAGAIVHFDKRAREIIRKSTPRKEYARIEQKLNAYIVESSDGSIVAVGYRYRPIHA